MKIEEFTCVLPRADNDDPCNFDDEERHDSEHECYVEIGVDAAQERDKFRPPHEADGANARSEFQEVGSEYEEENSRKEREKPARELATLENFRHVIVDEFYEPLEEDLRAARSHLEPTSDEDSDNTKDAEHYPTREEGVGEWQTKKGPYLLGRQDDLYPAFHRGHDNTKQERSATPRV